jgi:DNA-binding IscR family transcriptional regulator
MVWARVGERIEEALDSITFEDLLRQAPNRDPEQVAGRRKAAASGKGAC